MAGTHISEAREAGRLETGSVATAAIPEPEPDDGEDEEFDDEEED